MFIVFEGVIGAGKTTWARALATRLGDLTNLVEEQYDDNTFLRSFYDDEKRWALAMQLQFLSDRTKQFQDAIAQRRNNLIADHSPEKCNIFANAILEGDELQLFRQLADLVRRCALSPDIIIWLDAPDDIILKRIHRRGRQYELRLGSPYLAKLRRAYEPMLVRAGRNVIRLDTSKFDPSSHADVEYLVKLIERTASAKTSILGQTVSIQSDRKVRFLTSNPHKIAEVKAILEPHNVDAIPISTKVDEIQTENATALVRDKLLKAFHIIGKPVFVEHTALNIPALNGLPGGLTQIFWDKLQADAFVHLVDGLGDRRVLATTTIGYCDGKKVHYFEGQIGGTIAPEASGPRDFQWDCIFIPDGHDKTFADLGPSIKNKMSMRAIALEKLAKHIQGDS